MLYFAYGSNLNVAHMARRCPAATSLGKLVLPDTRLVFRGVADVIPQDGFECPGGLWDITDECERTLDRYEGVNHSDPERGSYAKELVQVAGLPNGATEVMLYTMNSTGIYPPSVSYFETIKQGYKDFGLPLAALIAALQHSYDDKRPTHRERKRTRRLGRPALAQVPRKSCEVRPKVFSSPPQFTYKPTPQQKYDRPPGTVKTHPFCDVCKATGKVDHPRLPFRKKTCDRCGGRGRIIPQPHYKPPKR